MANDYIRNATRAVGHGAQSEGERARRGNARAVSAAATRARRPKRTGTPAAAGTAPPRTPSTRAGGAASAPRPKRRGHTDTLTAGKPKFSGRDVVGDGKNKGDGSGKNKSTGRITKGRATGKPRSKGSSSDDRFIDSSYVGDYKEGSPKGVKYKAWLADTGRKSTSNLAAIWSHANGRELNAQMLASAAGRRIAAKKDKPKPPKSDRPGEQGQHPITERRQMPTPRTEPRPPKPPQGRGTITEKVSGEDGRLRVVKRPYGGNS